MGRKGYSRLSRKQLNTIFYLFDGNHRRFSSGPLVFLAVMLSFFSVHLRHVSFIF